MVTDKPGANDLNNCSIHSVYAFMAECLAGLSTIGLLRYKYEG